MGRFLRACLFGSLIFLWACGGIPSNIDELDLPYMEGAEITSSLDRSCGYKFSTSKDETALKTEFVEAVKAKGWKPSDKKAPEVVYMGMLFEKGNDYLAIHPLAVGAGEWSVTVSLAPKDAEVWQ